MNKFFFHILSATLLLLATLSTAAQTLVTFDKADYKAVGTYDNWEASPFRTGALTGLAQVTTDSGAYDRAANKVLAFMRSRYASNIYGARIDLAQTFELTPQTQFVHVLMCRPQGGRVMLVGLGKRKDRPGQSAHTEQFWVYSSAPVPVGKWADAVFPIKGAGGIDIYSLVVVPDAESPHDLQKDFQVLIDDIALNGSSSPRIQLGADYPLSFPRNASWTDGLLRRLTITTSSVSFYPAKEQRSAGFQPAKTISTKISFTADSVYNLLPAIIYATPGSTVPLTIDYEAHADNPVHAYCYVDYGQDGSFSTAVDAKGVPTSLSDLVAYSYYDDIELDRGHNSKGALAMRADGVKNMPDFTLPSSLPYSTYCMRLKMDYCNLDAAGRMDGKHNITNEGMVADLVLRVHGQTVTVNEANRNGAVLRADGGKLGDRPQPFMQPLKIKVVPAPGFTFTGVKVRHGYHLSGPKTVHGVEQYQETVIDKNRFSRDNTYTLPPDLINGNVEIEGLFVSVNK